MSESGGKGHSLWGAIIGAFGGPDNDRAAVVVTRVLRVIDAVTIRAAVGVTIMIGGDEGDDNELRDPLEPLKMLDEVNAD